jgi:hypothetical protein
MSPGSVVLFRYGHEIVGEAVVQKGIEDLSGSERNLWTGEVEEFEAMLTLAPSSIRLYSPPVDLKEKQKYVKDSNITTAANLYYELDGYVYVHVLREVVALGGTDRSCPDLL